MNFASVEKIAAAVLYEGYILYPYRADRDQKSPALELRHTLPSHLR